MSFWYVGAMVVAGLYSMYSQYQQGKAQEKMYQAQADQARQEAIVAEERAQAQSELAQDQAKTESRQLKRQQMQFLAKQEATLAAMGITGVTPADIISDTVMMQDIDKSTLKWNADMASWEAKTTGDYQAWASRNQGAMADAAKYNTRQATKMNMTSTFLNTVASVTGAFKFKGGNTTKTTTTGTSNMQIPKSTSYQSIRTQSVSQPRYSSWMASYK